MKTQWSSHGDTLNRYVAKVNALISDDREDLVGEIIAEYSELPEARAALARLRPRMRMVKTRQGL